MSIKHLISASALSLLLATPALPQNLADDETTQITTFSTLTNGKAAATLIWNLNSNSPAQYRALQAYLSAKVNSGTDTISTRDSIDFRTINAVDFQVSATPTHLALTVEAPQETFDLAIAHLNTLMTSPSVNPNWLTRQTHAFRAISSTRLRTPGLLESELVEYALFPNADDPIIGDDLAMEILRRPNQIIMNAKDFDFGDTPQRILDGMFSFDAELNNSAPVERRALPSGTIHLADPDTTETLIFMGYIKEFESVEDQIQSDTLYKYMGYGPGSEMFRIVRQEKRASYDPTSHFTQIGEQLAITGLSATVPSQSWPEIYDVIAQIYDDARAGKNTQQGLDNSQDSMLNVMIGDLRREPTWLVERYLELHPIQPPKGPIKLDLINAGFDMDVSKINDHAADILSPRDDMITVILGGTIAPSEEMRKNGYCELPLGEPLAYCLDQLAKE